MPIPKFIYVPAASWILFCPESPLGESTSSEEESVSSDSSTSFQSSVPKTRLDRWSSGGHSISLQPPSPPPRKKRSVLSPPAAQVEDQRETGGSRCSLRNPPHLPFRRTSIESFKLSTPEGMPRTRRSSYISCGVPPDSNPTTPKKIRFPSSA